MECSENTITSIIYNVLPISSIPAILLWRSVHQNPRNYSSSLMMTIWNRYILRFLSWTFPLWSGTYRLILPLIIFLTLPILIAIAKPPYWTYFEIDKRNINFSKLQIYPKKFMIVSSLQMFSLSAWIFNINAFINQGFLPF